MNRDEEIAVSAVHSNPISQRLTEQGRSANLTVDRVMTRGVLSAHERTPIKEVIASMVSQRVSTVPVLDPQGRVIGVVTSADLLARMSGDRGTVPRGHRLTAGRELGQKAAGTQADDVMTAPAITALPSDSIATAAQAMARARVRCLPVVDCDGILVGIITKGDLLKNFLRNDEEVRRTVEEDVIGRLLLLDPYTVTVSVNEGIVTLCGSVETPALGEQLVRTVRELPGVIDVDSRQLGLRVDPIRTRT
jgi:CBS domain-containing protein